MRKWSIASALIAVVSLWASVYGQQAAGQQQPRGRFADGEILVRFSPTLNANQRNAILNTRRALRIKRFAHLDIDHIRVPAELATAAAALFRAMPGVLAAQPNYTRHIIQTAPPNDPFWLDGSLWGLSKIQAQQTWTTYTVGSSNVIVANIDTGVEYTHPDLVANMWRNPFEIPGNGVDDDGNGYVDDVHGIDTANHDSDPMDDQGHGTHTAGTVAAAGNNGIGAVGVGWNTKLLSCKFLDASGYGTDSGAIECFNYIVSLRNRGENIRVSTNSWGAARDATGPSPLLEAAIDAAGMVGIINIFGAGNDGEDNDAVPFDPASYDVQSIVAVASSGQTDRRSFFSNYGATSVDLAAPGEGIVSTYLGGSYASLDGTSMATPHVAGAAALLASMDPTLSPEAMKALLMDNVDQSSRWAGRVVSGGRLNVFRAAGAVGTGTPNDPPTVSLIGPASGSTFKAPATIVLDATAADTDGSVQHVSFYANGSPLGTDSTSPYGVTWLNAQAGTYTLTAVATDNQGAITASAPVTITIFPNAPPLVSITSPAEGAVFTSPATVTIDVTASDSDGAVGQVSFYANGSLIGLDPAAPYSFTWTAHVGSHILTAVATDNEGATSTSPPVNVTVNPIPNRINVARSSNGGIPTASSTMNANYPPSGAVNGDRRGLQWGQGGGWNDGTPNAGPDWFEVRFSSLKLIEELNVFSMQDNYTNPIEPTPTLTFGYWGLRGFNLEYWTGAGWAPVPGGTITNNNLVWRKVVFAPITTSKIRMNVTAALNGYSRLMEIEAWGVSAAGNQSPDVAITSPADNATFLLPAPITVEAAAQDFDGSIDHVEFFANGASIGTVTSSPYRLTWTGMAPGTYVLTAVATDNESATTTSLGRNVTVLPPNVPPSVSITSPSDGSSFAAPASVAVSADASDSNGTVTSVAFFANGVSLGTDTSSPFQVTWNASMAGSYTLTAVATDNHGGSTTSAPIVVTITAPPDRLNMALAANGGVATASSMLGIKYPPSGAINGDRRGIGWGNGGGWNDGTPNSTPDWLEVTFNGPKMIDEVNVFSMQDNYTNPIEPTPTMTFLYWGVRGFEVQYWTGSAWAAVPGGTIANNNLVWRRVLFAPITTTKIRIHITAALNGYSRLIEVEAWGR